MALVLIHSLTHSLTHSSRYITQGLPAMFFTFIPFLSHGVWLTMRQYPPLSMTPLLVAILLVIVHSLIGHKEFRFILPSLTLSMPYIGKREGGGR